MPKLHTLAALVAASVVLVFAGLATAAPVTVNVRVEGTTQTFFEGQVTTDTHLVDGGDGTHAHQCDGLNDDPHKYAGPGPTVTGAFDDASRLGPFSWYGTYGDYGIADFLIHAVNDDNDNVNNTSGTYWSLYRNWAALTIGGCQEQVQQGDNVLVARTGFDAANNYDPFPALELRGAPASAAVGQPFTVHVFQHDGSGAATDAAGATVAGGTTGSDGTASISFDTSGTKRFKAERSGSTRSNAASICVYAPGSGECGTEKSPSTDTGPTSTPTELESGPPAPLKDVTAPVIHIGSPLPGKKYARGPRVLAGDVDEANGIAQVFLRLRATDGGALTSASRCRWFSGKRGVFTHRTVPCSKARYFRIGSNPRWSYLLPARLRTGKYVLDVKVLDRSYNAGRAAVPFGVK
jgi:hypothetical protein